MVKLIYLVHIGGGSEYNNDFLKREKLNERVCSKCQNEEKFKRYQYSVYINKVDSYLEKKVNEKVQYTTRRKCSLEKDCKGIMKRSERNTKNSWVIKVDVSKTRNYDKIPFPLKFKLQSYKYLLNRTVYIFA